MIQAEHIDQARTRLRELETLTGYEPGTVEWFETVAELVGAEPLALTEMSLSGLAPLERCRGLLVGMLAARYADAELPPGLEGAAAERSRRGERSLNDHPPAEVDRRAA